MSAAEAKILTKVALLHQFNHVFKEIRGVAKKGGCTLLHHMPEGTGFELLRLVSILRDEGYQAEITHPPHRGVRITW